jgi:hypothetical protein
MPQVQVKQCAQVASQEVTEDLNLRSSIKRTQRYVYAEPNLIESRLQWYNRSGCASLPFGRQQLFVRLQPMWAQRTNSQKL